ncbi:2-oxoglutarate-dependent dioxygenase htyE-like [Notolabrus celidotus]|uniref:2-oxoglutarate-dependent dioxygenase htyE-like n=1 Tax=Notolabrus celidotus TaxID=1203425 RepID=UPI0014900E75|nr:2-oxoglutarate-dependent dioxygenase htyE-like [Notolabrus celidotus]
MFWFRWINMSIPEVDFSAYGLKEKDVSKKKLKLLSWAIKKAFTKVGFVLLTNTGITQEEICRVMEISRIFFLQPEKEKVAFKRGNFSHNPNHGWVSLETERLNPRRPGDLKEAFNVLLHPDIRWPSVESDQEESFEEIHTSFFRRCKELSLRVLRVMAYCLNLDPEVFLAPHRNMGEADTNATTLRSLYYPPVKSEEAKEGQLRCGEHSDYGSITLLFQSSEGLEVLSRTGEYMAAPCIPGGVLVNIADLMQRWTGDKFVSVIVFHLTTTTNQSHDVQYDRTLDAE